MSAAQRYNFRRRLANLKKRFALRFETVISESRRREVLPLLVALHHKRHRQTGGSDAFHTPALVAFHEELSRWALERGWLRLFVMWLDGRAAASLYGFRYGPTFFFYQSGFDPEFEKQSVGLVTLGLSIQSASEEGVEEYDLLHGDEPYKFHWAREARDLIQVELYPPSAGGRLCHRVAGWRRSVKSILRSALRGFPLPSGAPGDRGELWGGLDAAPRS